MRARFGRGLGQSSSESDLTRQDSLANQLTPQEIRSASLLVASSALDAADCVELLTMLGLITPGQLPAPR